MNWLDQLYVFRDDIQTLWNNPGLVFQRLQSDHVFLLEVVGVSVVLLFLFYVLLKPAKKIEEQPISPTVQKANERASASNKKKESKLEVPKDAVIKSVKAVQEQGRQKQLAKQQIEGSVVEPHEPSWQELSNDEEAALAEAMQNAGKQALAEIKGAPHQVEFFEDENAARDAAKKMFSKIKGDAQEDISAMQMPLKKALPLPPKLEFLMIYYMAPASQPYKVFNLFNIFESFNLTFNESQVFEYEDQQGLQFYIASALKPGVFDADRQGVVLGLSFVLDLQSVQDPRGAFNKMLIFIDALSKQLPGDILDEQRQRVTTVKMNEYLARIKNFHPAYK